MSIEKYWSDREWQEFVIKQHKEMLDEKALYEELADSNEMSEEDYHKMPEYFLDSSGLETAAAQKSTGPAMDSKEGSF